mgnify:CR=1 FL=1|jgi:hypothetical protein
MPNLTTSNSVDTFMQSANQGAMRTNLGLGDSATKNTGTTNGTVAAGDDSRITGAVQTSRTISAGTGLSGGGDLSSNRTLSVVYGTTSSSACRGDDVRLQSSFFNYYGAGSYTGLQNPFGASKPALVDIFLCSGGGGGGGGQVCSPGSSSDIYGGGGGSMGLLKVIRGFYYSPNTSFDATVGAGGAGGQGAICTSGGQITYATNGGPGGGSILTTGGATLLDCTQGLTTTGGAYSTPATLLSTEIADFYLNEPWLGGISSGTGEAGSPTRDTMANRPFIAHSWQQSGGSGGGVTSPYTAGINNGAHGGNAWNTVWGVRYGEDVTFDAPLNPFTLDGDIARVYNRGYGGSGGASAYQTNYKDDGGDPRAGHGSNGAQGCGGGGGGAFAVNDPISMGVSVRGGNGGAGGDGFLILVWHNIWP